MTATAKPIIAAPEAHAQARLAATHYKMYQKIKQKITQQIMAWDRYKMDVPVDLRAWVDENVVHINRELAALDKVVKAAWKGTLLYEWAESQHGLGPALFRCLSLMPPLTEFDTVSKVWAFMGLHAKGSRGKYDEAYSRVLKVWAIHRVAEPTMKQAASPYRAVYLDRKARLPDMLEEGAGCEFCDEAYAKRRTTGKTGWDCHNQGGPHYKAAHRHADALRVTAKAIMRDCWCVAHGKEPRNV